MLDIHGQLCYTIITKGKEIKQWTRNTWTREQAKSPTTTELRWNGIADTTKSPLSFMTKSATNGPRGANGFGNSNPFFFDFFKKSIDILKWVCYTIIVKGESEVPTAATSGEGFESLRGRSEKLSSWQFQMSML